MRKIFTICITILFSCVLSAKELNAYYKSEKAYQNALENGLSIKEKKGKFGYANSKGKFIIKPVFEEAYDFTNNLAVVKYDGKWGAIDLHGNTIIEPVFEKEIKKLDYSNIEGSNVKKVVIFSSSIKKRSLAILFCENKNSFFVFLDTFNKYNCEYFSYVTSCDSLFSQLNEHLYSTPSKTSSFWDKYASSTNRYSYRRPSYGYSYETSWSTRPSYGYSYGTSSSRTSSSRRPSYSNSSRRTYGTYYNTQSTSPGRIPEWALSSNKETEEASTEKFKIDLDDLCNDYNSHKNDVYRITSLGTIDELGDFQFIEEHNFIVFNINDRRYIEKIDKSITLDVNLDRKRDYTSYGLGVQIGDKFFYYNKFKNEISYIDKVAYIEDIEVNNEYTCIWYEKYGGSLLCRLIRNSDNATIADEIKEIERLNDVRFLQLIPYSDKEDVLILKPDLTTIAGTYFVEYKNNYIISKRYGYYGLYDKDGKQLIPSVMKDKEDIVVYDDSYYIFGERENGDIVFAFSDGWARQISRGDKESLNSTYQVLIQKIDTTLINEGKFHFMKEQLGISNGDNYVDLGLPSGLKWKSSNEPGYYTYNEAVTEFGEQLPSLKEWEELFDNCNATLIDNGVKMVGKNGNYIILPAMGFKYCQGNKEGIGSEGRYWSSSEGRNSDFGVYYGFDSEGPYINAFYKCYGNSIRLVKGNNRENIHKEKESSSSSSSYSSPSYSYSDYEEPNNLIREVCRACNGTGQMPITGGGIVLGTQNCYGCGGLGYHTKPIGW